MLCICCNKKIKPLFENEKTEEQIVFEKEHIVTRKGCYDRTAANVSWDDGITGIISAGYGSSNDGNVYVITVCDECLKVKTEAGVVAVIDNYIAPISGKEFLKEHREVWKKLN